LLPNTTGGYRGWGGNIAPSDGDAYVGIQSIFGTNESFGQQLRTPLKAGATYIFLVDVAYADNYNTDRPNVTQVPLNLLVKGGQQTCLGTLLWSKEIPVARTTWQTDTITITPAANIFYLEFEAAGTSAKNKGGLLIDNLRTLSGIVLKKEDGTAQVDGKQFQLLWQPVLAAGDLDSLVFQPQLKGTVTTSRGGRFQLPAALRVTDAKGFYFLKEAVPAAGQDTTYYGLYVRNKMRVASGRDDTLRNLYQCQTYGSQSSLLSDSLEPLAIRGFGAVSVPKELRLAARPPADPVLANYEQFTGGSLTDFDGNGLLTFTPRGSWRIANGKAATGTYRRNQLSELVSNAFRLDTTLSNRGFALMGFALYFDEQYRLESGHDYGSVYLQYQKPDQRWSEWTLLSQRTGQSPGNGSRTSYLSLRDTALWHKNIRLKFSLQSDCGTQFEGWTLDNVTVRQIVTTPEIRTALVPVPKAPPLWAPYVPGGIRLQTPINDLDRLVKPALDRLMENKCRLDVTFVINGAHVNYNAVLQNLPSLVNTNLDELAGLLTEARQGACKQVRFLVAGGNLRRNETVPSIITL
jgi:hypothetical protein